MSDAAAGPDGKVKPDAAENTDESQTRKNGRAESWQADPSDTTSSNDEYTRESHKATGRSRTDLRTTDAHASWREVYRACHVGVGVND